MSSGPSGSDTPGTPDAFGALHPEIQRWLWRQQWTHLRPVQQDAIHAILDAPGDVIIAAPTASGKTEAAWLPICSMLAEAREPDHTLPGLRAIYLAPLKALINDQHTRVDDLCRALEIPVHRWHGDVAGSRKTTLLRNPSGVLLITPESLEALFVTRGTQVSSLFSALTHIVIDELHSFLGSERGAQLQSLMHRIDLAAGRRIPRIALSATLGDFSAASRFLRHDRPDAIRLIRDSDSDGGEIRMQVRGYVHENHHPTPASPNSNAHDGTNADAGGADDLTGDHDESSMATVAIVDHLYKVLRGRDNLVFANSRGNVEYFADRLSRRCQDNHVPNEFVAHHGNLSRELREDAESRLKDPTTPTTAVCTSTLEMGIDIGSVHTVAQIGAPPSVSSLRQRLGRSGRREGEAAELRGYVVEHALDGRSGLAEQLRSELVQAVAMIDLLLVDKWYESPVDGTLHLSTLIQQTLSIIAERGGVHATRVFRDLCGTGPFHAIDSTTFATLLRAMAAADLIEQDSSGLLLPGGAGEKLINHYSFYAAFSSTEEYRVIADGRPIGTVPITKFFTEGSLLIFGGRRWRVLNVDNDRKVLTVTRAGGGRPPSFTSDGPSVTDEVRTRMRQILGRADVPTYLDPTAVELLAQARAAFSELTLDQAILLGTDTSSMLLPWRGDCVMDTLALAFSSRQLNVESQGLALRITASPEVVRAHAAALVAAPRPAPERLARLVIGKERDKHDRYLTEELQCRAYAASCLDLDGTWEVLAELAADATYVAAPNLPDLADDEEASPQLLEALAQCGFAVIDVETTGLYADREDRIIEIAIQHLEPDGTSGSTWSTLISPDRSPGPTHIHGLTAAHLGDAPRFYDITGDIANMLAGRIVVAHNALFDMSFLHAEFARAGHPLPAWPTLCTLEAAAVLRPDGPRSLADCTDSEGIDLRDAHSAAGDVDATARLLAIYLRVAATQSLALNQLQLRPLMLPPRFTAAAPSGLTSHRQQPRPGNSLPGFAARLANLNHGNAAEDAYLNALDQLAARGQDIADADALPALARIYGLTSAQRLRLTEQYLRVAEDAGEPLAPALIAYLRATTNVAYLRVQ